MTRKFRFNIFDAVIIILIALCAASIIMRSAVVQRLDETRLADSAVISFVIYGADEKLGDAMIAGDTYTMSEDGVRIGILADDYEIDEYIRYIKTDGGEIVQTKQEGLVNIKGSFLARGKINDGAFLLEGEKKLYINGAYTVESKNLTCRVTITQINIEQQ